MDAALAANSGEGITYKTFLRGRPALLDIASGNRLWDHSQPGHAEHIPQSGATMISFSNRGQGPCFYQLHLPAQALEFLSAILQSGSRQVFLEWAYDAKKAKRTDWLDELCGSVEERRSLAPLLAAMVKESNKGKGRALRKGEYTVLRIYEDLALQKKDRFEALEHVADKIRQMPGRYSDSFIKQLGNLGSKRTLLELLKDFCKRESAGLRLTRSELRAIDDSPGNETTSLLYLLCRAEDEGGEEE